ncbi:MAG: hypothetical protein WAP03_18810 [Methylorubrum rhodinum]|uniref:hypothetical protein n=1 Tax=Methylorubrum rhodinum TaxID=29428 RepID=UPI003BB01511
MLQDQSRNRTPMPGAQAPGAAPPDAGPARAEAGIAAMLAEPSTSSAVSEAALPIEPGLAQACLAQAERLKRWDENPGSLSEEASNAEMARWGAIFRRAVEEPSTDLTDLAAKARLVQDDMDRFLPADRYGTDNYRLMRVILHEVVALAPSDAPLAPPTELPAPGSPEAMGAFAAACRAVNAVGFLDEAERQALKIGDGLQYWTSEVVEAARLGDFSRIVPQDVEAAKATSPARLDDLLVLALRRELRIAEATQDSRLRQLFVLAYPDDQEEVADDADAVDLAIEAHRAARTALTAACNPADAVWVEQNGGDTSDEAMAPARAVHETACDAETDAWNDLLETRPSDADGLLRMLRYVASAGPMDVLGDAREFGRNIAEAAEAALMPAIGADAQVIAMGQQFDRLHAAWLLAVEAAREPGERYDAFMAEAKARGGPTIKDIKSAWALPGVNETHDAEETAFAVLSRLGNDILKRPVRTVQGLAVQARATIPQVWPNGTFEADAALAPDEDVDKEAVRAFIESCCALARIDWRGKPGAASQVETSKPTSASAPAPDPVHTLIAEHRAAYEEWDRLSKVWGDCVFGTVEERAADEARKPSGDREVALLNALITARPTTLAGIAALAEYLPGALRQVDPNDHEPDSEVALRNVAAALRAIGTPVVTEPSLSDQIIAGWRVWGARPDRDESEAGQAEFDRLSDQRNKLIDAAEALPATPDNVLPKALASAWLDYVGLWSHGLAREDYGSDGRLALDIDTAICGRLKTRYAGDAA